MGRRAANLVYAEPVVPIEDNLGLVHLVVRKYFTDLIRSTATEYEYDDLYSIGCIGLIKACRNFDPDYGVAFSTYAVPKIYGEIKRHLRDSGLVKYNRATHSICNEINKYNALDIPSTILAEVFNYSVKAIDAAKHYSIPALALDAPIKEMRAAGNDALIVRDTIMNEDIDFDFNLILQEALMNLSPIERQVFDSWFNLEMTQLEIATNTGCSQVHISRMLRSIKCKLRKYFSDGRAEVKYIKRHRTSPKKEQTNATA